MLWARPLNHPQRRGITAALVAHGAPAAVAAQAADIVPGSSGWEDCRQDDRLPGPDALAVTPVELRRGAKSHSVLTTTLPCFAGAPAAADSHGAGNQEAGTDARGRPPRHKGGR